MITTKQSLLSYVLLTSGVISLAMETQTPSTYSPFVNVTPSKQLHIAQKLFEDEDPAYPSVKEFNKLLQPQKDLVMAELSSLTAQEAREAAHAIARHDPENFYKSYRSNNIAEKTPLYFGKKHPKIGLKLCKEFYKEYARIASSMTTFMAAVENERPAMRYFDLMENIESFITQ